MTLKELKDWVNSLPEQFSEYEVCNAEFFQNEEEDYMYRLDKPVTMLSVSEETQEILILNDVIDDEKSEIEESNTEK